MRTAKIYKITNDINTKVYVGQTWRSLERRFKAHCSAGPKCIMLIARAIRTHGKQHFKIELLEEFPEDTSQEVVDSAEVKWGFELNALSPNGYSLRFGKGRGVCSDETKRKLSNALKGRIITEGHRKKLSETHLGVKHSEERNNAKSLRYKGIRPSLKAQIANKLACAKHYKLVSPEGTVVEIYNMSLFCKQHNLSPVRMCRLHKGQIAEHKGWRRIETKNSQENC